MTISGALLKSRDYIPFIHHVQCTYNFKKETHTKRKAIVTVSKAVVTLFLVRYYRRAKTVFPTDLLFFFFFLPVLYRTFDFCSIRTFLSNGYDMKTPRSHGSLRGNTTVYKICVYRRRFASRETHFARRCNVKMK